MYKRQGLACDAQRQQSGRTQNGVSHVVGDQRTFVGNDPLDILVVPDHHIPVSYTHLDVYKRQAEIYGLLEKLRADGKSIILISSETEEIQGTCDRTIVMRSGHVTGELNAEEMKDTKLMLQYMYKDV